MKRITCMLALALLVGCQATPQEQPAPVQVDRLVPVACIDKRPERPVYRYGKGPEPSDIEKGAILVEDFEKAEQYGIAWETAAAGCIKPVASPHTPG